MKHFSFLLILIAFAVLSCSTVSAQMVGDNVFFPGTYLEVGQGPNGSLGTTRDAPSGYYARSPSFSLYDPALGTTVASTPVFGGSLAQVYDQGHDGWTVGTPAYFGDYTLPGTPYEGWGVEVDGTRNEQHFEYYNSGPTSGFSGGLGVSGTNTAYTSTGGKYIATWTGSTSGGLDITQTTEVDSLGSWVVFSVIMVNTTGTAMTNVYYERGCDPDNDSYTGGFSTTSNVINYQNDYAHRVEVTAAGTYYTSQTLSLLTKDCRAKCFIEPSWPPGTSPTLATVYSGAGGYVYTGSDVGDYAIGLVWNLGTLAAGDSFKLSYAYSFDGLYGTDSAITNPELLTLGAIHDTTDTVTSCAFSGDTLPVNIINATTGNWTASTWTWAPATGLTATTGLNSGVLITSITGITTYTITGVGNESYGACDNKTFLLTVLPAGPPPAPVGHDTSYCLGAATTYLTAVGTGLLWYPTLTGGTGTVVPPTPSSATVGTFTYYVSQTIAGCVSARAAVNVTILPLPSAITGPNQVCPGTCIPEADSTLGGTWSIATTSAATISGSGMVCGVTSGLVTISYTSPLGCSVSRPVTVVALPAAISGPFTVCQNTTLALTDAGGGSWSSSNTAAATIGSTGIVTGVSPGTSIITYSIGTGCNSTAVVTVNAAPDSITGMVPLCPGTSVTLADLTTGGTWGTGNPSIASVGLSSGIVTGGAVLTTANITITFTAPNGCTATAVATVNPLPGGISSTSYPPTVCVGATAPLSDGGGGTWISSNTLIATVGPTITGIFGGVASGTATVTYTLPTGCTTTIPVIVNPLPGPITGTLVLCDGGATTTLDDTTFGTWVSSDLTVASIDPFSGIVTSGSAGTTTIDFINLFTGCSLTSVVTVNPSPPTIIGPAQICVGATIQLINAVTGGTWTSSNTAAASVGSSSGVVTGGAVTATGSVMITYTSPSGCFTTTYLTIYLLPPLITGTMNLCAGQSVVLNDATGPGIWSSDNTVIASVVAGTPYNGIVTGGTPGTDTIAYTITGTGCARNAVVTVNAAPGPISGPLVVCAGSTTDLTDGGGGTWVSGSGAVATAGLTTGVIGGVGPGTSTITYSTGGTCTASAIVTVNATPPAFTLSASSTSYCAGGAGVTLSLSGSTVGVKYQLDSAGIATGSLVSGTGVPISFGLRRGPGPYTVTATYTTSGCSRMMGSVTLTVNPLPPVFNVTGGGSYCSGAATGVAIGLDGSSSGVTYRLYNGTVLIGAPVAGTGLPLSFGTPTGAGTYKITATNSSGCIDTMAGSAIIAINALPAPHNVTGGGIYCAGGTGDVIGLNFSDLLTPPCSVSYQLFNGVIPVGLPVAGTGGAISFGLVTGAGTYTVVATNTCTGCSRTMTGSAVVTISPIPVISGATAVCVGATIPESPAGSTWSSTNTSVAIIGFTTGFVTGVATGTTTIICTSAAGCTSSEVITVSSSPGPIMGANTVCVGATTIESDTVTGGLWAISPGSVATIGSLSGVVTGVATGPVTTITYSLGGSGCTVTKTLTVTPAPGAISGPAILCTGAGALYGDATTGGTWTSGNTAVATTSGGTVTGAGVGTATIIYTLGGCTSTATVTVNPAPGSISGPASVCMGSSVAFSDGGGGTWSSSNTLVATVGTAGEVLGVTPGTATITYSLGGSCAAGKTITVNAIYPISGITGLCVGTTTTLSDLATGGTWSSSTTAVTVPATTGSPIIATGANAGTAIITYLTAAGCSATTTLTVNLAPLVITGPASVCVGACVMLSDAAGGGTWSSPATTVTVNSTSGQVCGVVPGTATITYSLGFGCTKTAVVTVNPPPLAISGLARTCTGVSTTLSDLTTGGTWSSIPTSVATVTAAGTVWGAATPGTATITYSLASGCSISTTATVNPLPLPVTGLASICEGNSTTLADGTSGGTWSSSNTTVAPIVTGAGGVGIVSGNNPGVTTITYSLGTGCTATDLVTVLPPPSGITGAASVCAGQSAALHDAAPGGAWATGPSSLATISGGGVLWGVASGTVLVSYTISAGCSAVSSIIVNALSPVTGGNTVCAGLGITLTDTTDAGAWSSSNTSVATVITSGFSTGLVGGAAAGTDTIIYTLPTGCIASKTITVNPAPPPIAGVLSVCAGSTTSLTDAAGGGAWSSGNTAIAAVSGSGVVHGITNGVAPITYTVPGTGCPAVAMVTVNPVPPAIEGPGAVCLMPGATILLTDALTGGVWSSAATLTATVDSVTGIVTGEAIGHTTILYTVSSGCAASAVISVDALPSAILGTSAIVCAGSSITLTDATPGGSWSSGNTFIASVDPSSGVVTGTGGGEAIISYTVAAGCPAIAIVTVNPLPDAIAGATEICQGTVMTLTDGTPGGTWISADTSVAHIDTLSGQVTAQGSGGTTITYTAPTGCTITLSLLVDPGPALITGPPAICLSGITTLSDAGGGTWSSSNTFVASVDGGGIVYGLSAGTALISYSTGGCPATMEVTVAPAPSAITGITSVCSGSSITLGDSVAGGTWSSSNTAVATVNTFTGVVTGITPVLDVADITYSTGAGCTADIIVTVNPLPAAITGTQQVCADASAPVFDGTGGGNWSSSNTEIATILPTGGVYYGASAGAATIVYTLPTGCAAAMAVTVNPNPLPIGGAPYICLGSTAILTDSVPGGTWSVSPPGIVSIASPLSGEIGGASLGVATVFYTLGLNCTVSASIAVEPLPTVYSLTGGGSYCNGGAGVPIGLSGSAVGVNYLLYRGAVATGTFAGTGAPLNFGLQTVAGPYTVIAITTSTGCSNIMTGSAIVTIMPTVAPSVSITPDGNPVCAGTSDTFTAVPSYGGPSPAYIWTVNGVTVGAAATYIFVPANGDVVGVTMASTGTCPSPATASSSLTMTVLPHERPSANVSITPGNPVCAGTGVTFTAAPSYGGPSPAYLWVKNGTPSGIGPVYSYMPVNGDLLHVFMTSDYLCRIADTVSSSVITIVVDTPVTPLVNIVAKPGASVAIGQFDTLTAVVTGETTGILSYQWLVNELPVSGATTNTYISNNFSNASQDSVTCVVTSEGVCTATSFGWAYINVHPEGVTSITGEGEITIVPNPSKGTFTIKGSLGTTTDEEVSIEITDMLGQAVYKEQAMAHGGRINERIQLNGGLANGMYLLNLRSGTASQVFHVVIEQ